MAATESRDENNHASVVLLCGLPGAGKSAISRQIVGELKDCHWIEYDALESQQLPDLGDDSAQASLGAWRRTRTVALHHLESLLQQESSPRWIVMDDNFHLRSMRKRVHQVCLKFSLSKPLHFGVVWVNTSIEECLNRNRLRSTPVSDEVIQKLAQVAEPPILTENRPDNNPRLGPFVWEAACIQVSGESADRNNTLQLIHSFLSGLTKFDAVRQLAVDDELHLSQQRQITKQSTRHQADIALRQCVRAVAQSNPSYAKIANQIRNSLLLQSDVDQEGVCEQFWRELCHLPDDEFPDIERMKLQDKILGLGASRPEE